MLVCLSIFCLPIRGASILDFSTSRAQSLGGATTSLAIGLDSNNPAGITSIHYNSTKTTYTSFFDNAQQLLSLHYGKTLFKNLHFSLALPIKSISDIPLTEDNNGVANHTGSFSDTEYAITSSLAISIKKLKLGLSANVTHHSIQNDTAKGLTFDAGGQLHFERWSIGMMIQHIGGYTKNWSTGFREKRDRQIKLGASTRLFNSLQISLDTSLSDDKWTQNVGGSYHLSEFLNLNAGIKNLSEPIISTGMTLDIGTFQIDYALTHHDQLGSTHALAVEFSQ